MPRIQFPVLLAAALLLNSAAQARDTGYALECTPEGTAPKLIVSFLETGVDKRVRYVKSDSGEMWDEHEWLADRFVVRSFRQSQDATAPTLISSLAVERESLRAVLVQSGAAAASSSFQCQQWSPRTRNK